MTTLADEWWQFLLPPGPSGHQFNLLPVRKSLGRSLWFLDPTHKSQTHKCSKKKTHESRDSQPDIYRTRAWVLGQSRLFVFGNGRLRLHLNRITMGNRDLFDRDAIWSIRCRTRTAQIGTTCTPDERKPGEFNLQWGLFHALQDVTHNQNPVPFPFLEWVLYYTFEQK